VPAFWGAVSIVAMWLAVLFDGIFGGDMVFSNPASAPTTIPSAVAAGGSEPMTDSVADGIASRVPPQARTGPGLRSRQGRLFGPSPRHPPTATVSLRCRPWAAPHLVSPGNPSRAEQKGSDP
jgi:hypothetical protein